jgi:hypothetical protein
MAEKTQTEEKGKAVRIHPNDSLHVKLKSIQSFIAWTKPAKNKHMNYVSKEEACLACIEEGIKVFEKKMKKYITA